MSESHHQGEWLRHQIAMEGGSVAAFARRAAVSRDALNKWFTQHEIQWRVDSAVRVLRALRFDVGQLLDRGTLDIALRQQHESVTKGSALDTLEGRYVARTLISRAIRTGGMARVPRGARPATNDLAEAWARVLAAEGSEPPPRKEEEQDEDDDQNIEIFGPLIEIPIFDISLAAGPWADVSGVPEITDLEQIKQGLFRVRLSGDSMRPTFKSGQIVEFRVLNPTRGERGDVLEPGKDYYVQRSDGTATFKRLQRVKDETMELRALNRQKYPRAMAVLMVDVVRVAKAVARVELLE